MEIFMEQIIEKWEEILRTVKEEHELTDISFKTWLEPLKVFDVKDNTLYILVPDEQMGLNYITKKPSILLLLEIITNWLMQLHWLLQNLREKSITHSFYMEA